MESSSGPPGLGLRQLMSLEVPRVALERKARPPRITKQNEVRPTKNITPSSFKPPLIVPSRHALKKESSASSSSRNPSLVPCSLCTTPHHASSEDDDISSDNLRRDQDLWSLLGSRNDESRRSLLQYCSVCLSALTRLLDVREEMEDIEARVRSVVQLRRQQSQVSCATGEEKLWPLASKRVDVLCQTHKTFNLVCKNEPGTDVEEDVLVDIKVELYQGTESNEVKDMETHYCPPSSPPLSFTIQLRQLMSLEFPKVSLGMKCDQDQERVNKASDSNLLPIKKESDLHQHPSDSSLMSCCSLCTHAPGDKKISFSDPCEVSHLRSLLRDIVDVGDHDDLSFCYVCRHALTKLFNLREEASEIETRIQTVVKLRESGMTAPNQTSTGGKREREAQNQSAFICSDADDEDDAAVIKTEPCEEETEDCPSGTVDASTILSTTEGTITLHLCPECGNKFGTKKSVVRHLTRVHCLKVRRLLRSQIPQRKVAFGDLPPIQKLENNLFGCPKCGKKFGTKKLVFQHLSQFHRLKIARTQVCPLCKKAFRSSVRFEAHTHPDPRNPSKVAYKCSLCQKLFNTPKILGFHKRQFHQRKQQGNCPTCGKLFQLRSSLKAHMTSCSVPLDQQKRCGCCGVEFASVSERLDHERVVHKGLSSHKCYFCPKTLRNETSLFDHLRIHTGERPYVCQKCGQDFPGSTGLWGHSLRVCGTDGQKKKGDGDDEGLSRPVFSCPHCNLQFTLKRRLLQHLSKVHGITDVSWNKFCPVCKLTFRSEELFKAHSHPDPSSVAYTCSLCLKVFPSVKNLRRHKHQVHKRTHQAACPACGKIFQSTVALRRHCRTCAVPEEEQKKCSDCGKVFRNARERFEHERVDHKGLTSNKCYFCLKICAASSDLGSHLRTHTRERPFFCPNCGIDFSDSSALKYHSIVVCGLDDQKAEELRERGRSAYKKRSAHLLYSCDHCDKRFGVKASLISHQRIMH